MSENNQVCVECGQEKVLEDFPIDKRAKTGHKKVCKMCFNEKYKDRNSKKTPPEKVLKAFLSEKAPDIYKALSIQSITEERDFIDVLLGSIKPEAEFMQIVQQYKKGDSKPVE